MRIGLHDSTWGELICGGHMYVATIAELLVAEGHDVTIVHHRERLPHSAIAEAFDLDLSGVTFRRVDDPDEAPASGTPRKSLAARLDKHSGWEAMSAPYDLFLHSTGGAVPRRAHARRNALLIHFPWIGFEAHHRQDDAAWARQPAPLRLLRGRYHEATWGRLFASYHLVMVNSAFTREWVGRRWRVDSTVVYPPTRAGGPGSTAGKRATILALGRLSPDKNADRLIEAFRTLCDRGLAGWRLALVGGSPREPELAGYVAALHDRARGYPIDILSDLPGADLARLLGEASLFWHAKGLGVDPLAAPQDMEHFGIATVEAMAAGAVPLVFRGGGQPEIVRHGRDGCLWDSTDQLVDLTAALVGDDARREALALAAIDRAAAFSKAAFRRRFLDVIAPLLDGRG